MYYEMCKWQIVKYNIFFFTLLIDYFIPLTTLVQFSFRLGEFKPLEHGFCPRDRGKGGAS